MAQEKQYLTSEKIAELTKELEHLRAVRRTEVAANLEYSKKLGDLSENAEYHQAREEQAEVEDRINYLDALLKQAVVIAGTHGDTINIGSTVRLQIEGEKKTYIYTIVGSEEADMSQGKISNLSPIGSALLGKKEGDNVSVQTPKGTTIYQVVGVK